MNKILLIIVCVLTTFICKGQTKIIDLKFNGYYKIGEEISKQYPSVLYDSTYYKKENLTFIRILFFVTKDTLCNSLVKGKNYKIKINRKDQFSVGCRNNLLSIRSGRGRTDVGTLFGSEFLEEEKKQATGNNCDYLAIEYYMVEEVIKKRNQKNFFLK